MNERNKERQKLEDDLVVSITNLKTLVHFSHPTTFSDAIQTLSYDGKNLLDPLSLVDVVPNLGSTLKLKAQVTNSEMFKSVKIFSDMMQSK